jgi:quercetin dioxygenase-like cupin family protein
MSDSVDRVIVCEDFNAALDRLREGGARLDVIYPADDPHTALLTQDGTRIRLTSRPDAAGPPRSLPPFEPGFVLSLAGGDGGQGRAGMLYRDLIPNRLGGRYIASHITIPTGGPVEDWVHFHRVAVQMIYVRAGWVRVVYEGQGAPFVMNSGDLVLQPPGIRHRVLESSAGLEVVEIGAPALHETFADHEMALPTEETEPGRRWNGQRFLRHVAADTPWTAFAGGEAQETGLWQATGGIMSACTIRSAGARNISFDQHDGELVFGFVLDGQARLDAVKLGESDAFVIPPERAWTLDDMSDDFRLLHVTTARLDDRASSLL